MRNVWKVISVNLFILIIGLFLIELLFGGWLRNDNQVKYLNILTNANYTLDCDLYSDKPIPIHYTRDKFGLRGHSSFNQPEKINILTVGGSTTDQRYITDGQTWQDVIENCFKENGQLISISNAGIDGQSTFGHLKNFQVWFPKIPNLKPQFVIFYIGINDFYRIADDSSFDYLSEPTSIKIIKEKSALINLYRTISKWRKSHELGIGHKKVKFSDDVYTDRGLATKELNDLFGSHALEFGKRISTLAEYCQLLGATPIFVSQPSLKYRLDSQGNIQGVADTSYIQRHPYNGVDYYHLLNKLNAAMSQFCKDKYTYIDLTNAPIWDEKDFYDFFHNTPIGTKKIGVYIYEEIKNKLR